MMQFIRDKAKGVVVWLIIGVITIVFASWGVAGLNGPKSKVVAKVGRLRIKSAEINDYYNRWFMQMSRRRNFDPNTINTAEIKQQITRGLAERAAILQSAADFGLAISKQSLLNSLATNPDLQENGKFSLQRYQTLLRNLQVSEQVFSNMQREEMLLNQLQNAVVGSSFALDTEVSKILALNAETRSFNYQILPVSKYESSVKISDAAIEEYYSANAADFVSKEKVKVEYVQLDMAGIREQIKITEPEIEQYYNDHKDFFVEPELRRVRHIMVAEDDKPRLERILERLQQGEDFASLATSESVDKASARRGGELGWITVNDGFPAEVYALTQVNAMTPVVKSEDGWHIFQVLELKGGKQKTLAETKERIVTSLQTERADAKFSQLAEEMGNLAFENPNSLQPIADNLGLKLQSTEFFERTIGDGVLASDIFVNTAFSEQVLAARQNSEVIAINDDAYVVLRVVESVPSRQQELAEVKDLILKRLQRSAAIELAETKGKELQGLINSGKTKLDKAWTTVKSAKRSSQDLNSQILQHAFSLTKSDTKKAAGFSLANGDYVLLVLQQIHVGEAPRADSEVFIDASSQIAGLEGRAEYVSMHDEAVARADIKYREISW